MPPKKKQCTNKVEDSVETIIENYLKEQYKPFTVSDIVNNLQKQHKISKTNAIKALEALDSKGKIISKVFGKITLYCCKEQDLALPKGIDPDQFSYELISNLREEFRLLQKDKGELLGKLNQLNSYPKNSEILDVLKMHKAELKTIEKRISDLKENWDPKNEEKIKELKNLQLLVNKDINKRSKIIGTLLAVIKQANVVPKGDSMDEFLVCFFNYFVNFLK
ncbi:Homologous-pairing protein 2 [Nakaseomyces bracarensis]|uniref:Homologous-pairing protein 2 n=1 Tax=Nakaseomyces bracarensis TaxID=273131 RepID=A0ABR4NS82_9SACH